MSSSQVPTPQSPRWQGILLWVMAFFIMTSAVIYQRTTGPTYPKKGTVSVQSETMKYRLVRSENSNVDAEVILPIAEGLQASLHYRRYNTDDDFTVLPMQATDQYKSDGPMPVLVFVFLLFAVLYALIRYVQKSLEAHFPSGPVHQSIWIIVALSGIICLVSAPMFYKYSRAHFWTDVPTGEQQLVAHLPKQPAAGKLEYFVELSGSKETRIPESPEEYVVIRFKDPVPAHILFPHVFMMFFGVLFGMRSGIAALFAPGTMRKTAWRTLGILSVGGMIFGPMVQKYAFGAFWTGYPYGKDLTDNKMLIMWLAWLFACSLIGFKPKAKEAISRIVVMAAMIIMTGVYLIPHSMRGSELDYSKVEAGQDPHQAIGTSDN